MILMGEREGERESQGVGGREKEWCGKGKIDRVLEMDRGMQNAREECRERGEGWRKGEEEGRGYKR